MMIEHNVHDATGQLSGYLYQVLSALLLLLESRNPDSQLCIEKFDDVAFVEKDNPQIMIQIKHQLHRQGNLSDTSTDYWRTIKSWCDHIKTMRTLNVQLILLLLQQPKRKTILLHFIYKTCFLVIGKST